MMSQSASVWCWVEELTYPLGERQFRLSRRDAVGKVITDHRDPIHHPTSRCRRREQWFSNSFHESLSASDLERYAEAADMRGHSRLLSNRDIE